MDVTAPLYARRPHLDGSTRMQYVDLFTWLRGDILVKADKMTMANSLELRVPFLDTEVFAVGSSIPTGPEADQGDDEVRAAPGARPTSCRRTCSTGRKLGFPVPIRHWLKDVMYDWARDDHHRVAGRRLIDRAAALRAARRAPRRPARLLAQDLDAAGVPDLARHLRRAAHPTRAFPSRSTRSGC